MTVGEVLDVVLRDKASYEASGGGITLSGGEALMQPRFALALAQEAKKNGLHCCIETAGHIPWSSFQPLVPLVDLWLFDVKETDSDRHKRFTGKPNELILSNLKQLHDEGANILVRCPMIPQHNTRQGHLDGIADLARSLPRIQGVELLPYHGLWRGKLDRFGLKSELPESVAAPEKSTVNRWKDYLRQRGVTVVG